MQSTKNGICINLRLLLCHGRIITSVTADKLAQGLIDTQADQTKYEREGNLPRSLADQGKQLNT